MSGRLQWETDGHHWPNREASRFVTAAGLRFHVQVTGQGPVLLLLHGTAAASHSWRGLMPLLARYFTLVAPDLPGHGFTDMPVPGTLTLPLMARHLADLLAALGMKPEFALGHSAGAAIAIKMCLDGHIQPRALVSLNGALMPYGGTIAEIFSPFARLLAANPLVPRFFAWQAGAAGTIGRLLDNTGSQIDAAGVQIYRQLISNPPHVAAALAMMAGWDLAALKRRLPKLEVPVLLVAGGRDKMIPAEQAHDIASLIPQARVVTLRQHGHLAHEQDPNEIASLATTYFAGFTQPAERSLA